MDYNSIYDKDYYSVWTKEGESYEESKSLIDFFDMVAERLIVDFQPKTVIEFGCAMGYLVSALRGKGVEAYGIDVSEYAISRVKDEIKPYCRAVSALEPLPEDFPKRYDLAVTIEVAEHLYEEEAVPFIRNICCCSNNIVFSSSIDDFQDETHYNVQQPEYWAKKFSKFGFYRDINKTPDYISPQAVIYSKKSIGMERVVENYERALRIQSTKFKRFEENGYKLIDGNKYLQLQNDELKNKESVFQQQIEELQRKIEEQDQFYQDSHESIKKDNEQIVYYQWVTLATENEKLKNENINLNNLQSEIDRIHSSRGFRLLVKLYWLRDLLFPPYSKRKKIIKLSYNVPRYAREGYIKKTLLYIKRNGFKGLKSKIGMTITPPVNIFPSHNYDIWIALNEPSAYELELQRKIKFPNMPKFSIVVPLYNTPREYLHDMIESVLNQSYENWELCLADGKSENHEEIMQMVQSFCNNKIKYVLCEENKGISGNTNQAISLATGDYIAFVDHDDTIAPFALFEIANCINHSSSVDFIYSDDDRITTTHGKRANPCFKPDFSIDRLRCCNYIGHLTVVKKSLMDEIGVLNSDYDGSQDYDFVLRATEKARRIEHIPKVLYHWRMHENSVSLNENSKTYAFDAAKQAIAAHIKRVGFIAEVKDGIITNSYKVEYRIEGQPKVSIIIPTMDHIVELRVCIESILEKTTYGNYEIVLVENNSNNDETFAFYDFLKKNQNIRITFFEKKGFNYSALINFGVNQCDGEYILTLNNDTEIITPMWIEEMLMYAQREDIGMVGAKLLYPDGTIWNTGIALDKKRSVTLLHNKLPGESAGYYGQAVVVQNYSALAGACLMIKKSTYLAVGGCDEANFAVAHNDMDLSLKLIQKGYRLVFTPYAEIFHYESKSRGSDLNDENLVRFMREDLFFLNKWKDYLAHGDPFYNTNLSLQSSFFEIKSEKVEYKY